MKLYESDKVEKLATPSKKVNSGFKECGTCKGLDFECKTCGGSGIVRK